MPEPWSRKESNEFFEQTKKRSTEEIYGQTEQDQLALLSMVFPGETKRKRFNSSQNRPSETATFWSIKKEKKIKTTPFKLFFEFDPGQTSFSFVK